jgi:hypothetical protein
LSDATLEIIGKEFPAACGPNAVSSKAFAVQGLPVRKYIWSVLGAFTERNVSLVPRSGAHVRPFPQDVTPNRQELLDFDRAYAVVMAAKPRLPSAIRYGSERGVLKSLADETLVS